MPDSLRAKLETVAEKNKRSLNAEIVALLESAVISQPSDQAETDLAGRVTRLEQQIADMAGQLADLKQRIGGRP